MVRIGQRADGSAVDVALTRRTRTLVVRDDVVTVDLEALAAAPALDRLTIEGSALARLAVAPIARHCPKLTSLSLAADELDLAGVGDLRALSYLGVEQRSPATPDLGPLATLGALTNLSLVGPAPSLDLSALAGCAALASLYVDGATVAHLDLAPLAGHARFTSLDLSACEALATLDLAPLATCGLTHLTLLRLALTTLDLAPLAACGALARIKVRCETLAELDVTPLAGLRALASLELHPRTAAVLSARPDSVRAKPLLERRKLGALRVRRPGVPEALLLDVAWSFGQHADPTVPAGVPAGVVCATSIRVLPGTDERGADRPPIIIEADRADGLTGHHLFTALRTRLGAALAADDHRFFEGLTLYRDSAWDEPPTYLLRLGS